MATTNGQGSGEERYTRKPPEGFDAEYAKFQLALEQAKRPRSSRDSLVAGVALLTSLSGAVLGLFNLLVYWSDRDSKARKETFDNQATVAKLYFEKVAALDDAKFCAGGKQASLFAKGSLVMAGLKVEEVPDPGAPTAAEAPERNGIQSLAILIYQDLLRRQREECGSILVTTDSKGGVVEAAPAPASQLNPYTDKQVAGAQAAVTPDEHKVFIQYPAGGRERADALRRQIDQDTRYRAPAVEQVRQVPGQDQIRIYKAADTKLAQDIQAKFNLQGAQIVSLERAFPKLPAGTIEIWLAR